ncbi:MAG: hypothetical protein LBP60_05560 [Spirochaetaceae bacterium]|jgi:hypothetical protein|nr:hypothetical protein [Spirochaetaceae bacterium]
MNDESAQDLISTVRRRIESRYRRIFFVHRELTRLNAAAKTNTALQRGPVQNRTGTAQKPGEPGPLHNNFEDFVFSQIDFSIYNTIDAEEYNLLFNRGLEDFDEPFFQKAFNMNREAVRRTIAEAYIKAGPFFIRRSASLLLLSIMRTLHTSLEFAPLLTKADVSGEDHLRTLIGALDGVVIRHADGTETRLFVPAAGDAGTKTGPRPLLCGTFYPLNKPWTITLIGEPES